MRKLTQAIAVALFALAMPGLSQPAMPELTPATQEEEAAALGWLKSSGHSFEPSAYGEAELAPLAEILGRSRIIGIGEATHGSHQDQMFKAELIKQLVRMGKIQVVVLEANRDAGYGFDRFVRYGEGDLAEVVRNGSFFRIWKGDEFAGLMLWLRAWNLQSENKVRVIGIDDQDPARDSVFALDFVDRFDKPAARRIRAGMGPLLPAKGAPYPRFIKWWVDAPKAEAESARDATAMLHRWFDNAPARAKADSGFREAQWAAETARQAYVIYEYERGDADPNKRTPEYYGRRDAFMAANAIGMVGADERAAIWAHDTHVMEDVPEMVSALGFNTLGSLIKTKIGEQYATVGFTWSQGSFRATDLKSMDAEAMAEASRNPSDDVVTLPNDRVGEAGHLFNQTGAQAMWIDISTRPRSPLLDAWAKRPYWRGYAGWGVVKADWQKFNPDAGDFPLELTLGHDVIVWFRTISPSHRWSVNPK
ncbi:MAG TPA: erythromycin esterase family protein [Novosphingobium sp.]|nr:erythromycin esterase family protein [Novosphingobium sp.]HQA17240.1 erythromycin esterase family protein [Novosphingobium sp.]